MIPNTPLLAGFTTRRVYVKATQLGSELSEEKSSTPLLAERSQTE